jgi:hypothetical protein
MCLTKRAQQGSRTLAVAECCRLADTANCRRRHVLPDSSAHHMIASAQCAAATTNAAHSRNATQPAPRAHAPERGLVQAREHALKPGRDAVREVLKCLEGAAAHGAPSDNETAVAECRWGQ